MYKHNGDLYISELETHHACILILTGARHYNNAYKDNIGTDNVLSAEIFKTKRDCYLHCYHLITGIYVSDEDL